MKSTKSAAATDTDPIPGPEGPSTPVKLRREDGFVEAAADNAKTDPDLPAPASLPIAAFVLGISAVVLGVTIFWYGAAIVVGLGAIGVGWAALRRVSTSTDNRERTRAIIGTVLGAVAIILGVTAAFLLPRVVDRVDNFFGTLQHGVNRNVDSVNRGLQADVDRLDRTTSRDLKRLEKSNREDLALFDKRSNESIMQLGNHLSEVESRLIAAERQDLDRLETSLREDARGLDSALRASDSRLADRIAELDKRLAQLEKELHP